MRPAPSLRSPRFVLPPLQARNYVLDMQEGPRTALPERFPDASADALDLLSKMLTFDPARRISVRDAMRHPWLARFYQVRYVTIARVRICV